jgi:hypothetical protein
MPATMDNHSAGMRAAYTRLASTAIAGEAIFSGCLSAIDVARHVVASLLPPSVALPRRDSAAYPCLLVFGEQMGGTTFFGGFSLPWNVRYHELMVAVPFVRWQGAAGEHLFVSGMTCDFWPAVWNGNIYYGFKKRFAQMSWSGGHFSVADENQRSGFEAVLGSRDEGTGIALDRIRTAAALPVLGYRQDGRFVRSYFDWDFRDAAVEAASLRLTLGQPFPELPLAAHSACHDEAYRIRGMHWRLSWPAPATVR